MSKLGSQTYIGIPRKEIAWFPTVDHERCDGCGDCVTHCHHDAFSVVDGKPVVAKPENCVVGCKACGWICPIGAITHPSKGELREILKRARAKYGFKLIEKQN